MRKTNKYYRDMLRKDITSASSIIKEVLEKYGKDKYRTEIRVRHKGSFWNCYIDSLGVSDNGRVYVGIYWQGDSTDGCDTCWLSDLMNRSEVVIGSTNKHSTLRIERQWLNEVFNYIADYIEPKAIKERAEYEEKCEILNKERKALSDMFYNNYHSTWGNNEKYYNGWGAVRAWMEENWKSLPNMTSEEKKLIAKKIYNKNNKYDKEFKLDENGKEIYDLSI